MTLNNKEKWFTIKEAVDYAGVSRATLDSAIRKGTLVASQISDGGGRYGFHYMISETALLEWVEDRKTVKSDVRMPAEMTVDKIADWITNEIQKAYENGFKDGMKTAREQMLVAAKGLR